jgi:hypothetical protein
MRGLRYAPTAEGTCRRELRRPCIVETIDVGLSDGSACPADIVRTIERRAAPCLMCFGANREVSNGAAFRPLPSSRGYAYWKVLRLEGSADDVVGVEVLGGEVDDPIGIERFAGVDVDREEQHGLVPGVEVRAGGFPMDPSGPSVAL